MFFAVDNADLKTGHRMIEVLSYDSQNSWLYQLGISFAEPWLMSPGCGWVMASRPATSWPIPSTRRPRWTKPFPRTIRPGHPRWASQRSTLSSGKPWPPSWSLDSQSIAFVPFPYTEWVRWRQDWRWTHGSGLRRPSAWAPFRSLCTPSTMGCITLWIGRPGMQMIVEMLIESCSSNSFLPFFQNLDWWSWGEEGERWCKIIRPDLMTYTRTVQLEF